MNIIIEEESFKNYFNTNEVACDLENKGVMLQTKSTYESKPSKYNELDRCNLNSIKKLILNAILKDKECVENDSDRTYSFDAIKRHLKIDKRRKFKNEIDKVC